jgi:hypothetical protein
VKTRCAAFITFVGKAFWLLVLQTKRLSFHENRLFVQDSLIILRAPVTSGAATTFGLFCVVLLRKTNTFGGAKHRRTPEVVGDTFGGRAGACCHQRCEEGMLCKCCPTGERKKAVPRFELGNKGFAILCLTTWLYRHSIERQSF